MAYPDAEDCFADAATKIALAKTLAERFAPIAGTPAETYLIKTRKLPATTVAACADLNYLAPPIDGRPPQDHALAALLRDAGGALSGFQLEFCDITGARTGTAPGKQAYTLRELGVRDGLFCAGGSGAVAHLCEGYSCKALALAALGLRAYGGGGRSILGCAVPPEDTVVIVPDRRPDDKVVDLRTGQSAGTAHDQDYKRAVDLLLVAGKQVLIAKAPECQHAGGGACKDADEYLRRHGPIRLRELVEATEVTALSLDGEARKLAQIDDPLERDQATKAKATELKVKVALLRERVTHYREAGQAGATAVLSGDPVEFADPKPWPRPVAGVELVAELEKYITDHVVVPEHAALVLALWVLHAHAYDAFYHSPRLVLRSPTKGCGKSTLRRVLSRLVPRPFEAVDITGPTLFRPIGQWRPTVFIDEANEINWAGARDLIAVVNSGHCRDDPGVPRCVGDDFDVRMFRVWAPLCLALIGFLPSPIAERSITIEMRKKVRTAGIQRLVRRDRDTLADQLARKAARWVGDHKIALENADPELPPILGDRPADNWRPLLAIADLIGLSKGARTAAVVLSPVDDDGEDLGVQLLADILGIFDQAKAPRLPSSTIVQQLLAMEERPWAELGRLQRPLTTTGMARLLKPFKIRPSGTIRVGSSTPKGYARAAFEDAWRAYSIICTPQQPPHRHNAGAEPVSEDFQPPHPNYDVADGIGPKATAAATCGGVADENTLAPNIGDPNGCERWDVGGNAGRQDCPGTGDDEARQAAGDPGVAGSPGTVAVDPGMRSPMGFRVQQPDAVSAEHPGGASDEAAARGAECRPATVPLTCAVCGGPFSRDAKKRGRRPSKCPGCGGGATAFEHAHQPEPQRVSADEAIAQVRAGERCAYCGARFRPGEEVVELRGRRYHDDDACAGEIRRRMAAEGAHR
jgi:putative DNA primase/helicase